jgi:drug/metabolite transporter (DMT)-like permease
MWHCSACGWASFSGTGLAQGGIAAVGQLQLLQPLLGLALAAWLLGEAVSPAMLAVTVAVIACVAGAKRVA